MSVCMGLPFDLFRFNTYLSFMFFGILTNTFANTFHKFADTLNNGTCDEPILCNVTDIFNASLSNANQTNGSVKTPVGIDLSTLHRNLSEIRQILIEDSDSHSLRITTPEDDRQSVDGSYIIPVLEKARYDNLTAPNFFSDIPVQVDFLLSINSLSNIDAARMEYTTDVDLVMQWRDVRLMHKFLPYILIKETSISERLWRPDPYFINEKSAQLFDVTYPNSKIVIFPDGQVIYVIRLLMTLACPMIFCRYPHDVQTCDLKLASIGYPSNFVQFSWFNRSAVSLNIENRLPLYEVNIEETDTCTNAGRIVSGSCLKMTFTLTRFIQNHLLRKYIPSVFAMIFSWSALYVPFEMAEVRIVNPVVVLLTLKQLQRADESLPPVSYVTALDIWFSTVQAFTMCALLEAVLYYSIMKRRNYFKKLAKKMQKENGECEKVKLIEQMAKTYKKKANFMDDCAKVVFPVLFIVFVLVYYYVVVKGDQNSCMSSRQ